MIALDKKILSTGNEAIAEAAIQAGCRFYAGYPITPQNEICAYFAMRMPQVGGTFIQSESELAAINMVLGALVAGAKAMTSSSSPGVSLMQEGISYIAACQLPAVMVNMMRGGPGLGDIRPSQSDYFQATKGGGHGDYRLITFAPATVQEAFELTMRAFDLAHHFLNPALILGDGILGQMMEPLIVPPDIAERPQETYDRSYVLDGCKGRQARNVRSLFLGEGELEHWNNDLQRKYRIIEKEITEAEVIDVDNADLVLVAYGSASRICKSVMRDARKEGLRVGLIRPITLWPFPVNVIKAVAENVPHMMVVEMSAGQMVEDVRLAVFGACEVTFHGRTGGGIPEERKIFDRIKGILQV